MKKRKLLTLSLSICLILALATVSWLTACAEPAPAPSPAPAPAPTPAPAPAPTPAPAPAPAPTKPMKLSLAYHFPAVSGTALALDAWAAKVEEQTQGRISFNIYPAASLVASGDQYEACVGGIADVIFTAVNSEPDAWPLNQVLMQPAVGVPMGVKSSAYFKEVRKDVPELAAEMGDIKVLMNWRSLSETNIHTTEKEIHVPDDIVGLKIIAIGSFVEFVRVTGGTPLALEPTEHYMAIERGMGDGLLIPYTVMNIHGCTELLPYHLSLDLAGPPFLIIMNLDKWNSVSPGDQKIMEELSDWAVEETMRNSEADMQKVFALMQELGHTIIDPTPEEFALWQAAGKPMADKWIEENEAKGRPAKKIFEEAVRIAEKYR